MPCGRFPIVGAVVAVDSAIDARVAVTACLVIRVMGRALQDGALAVAECRTRRRTRTWIFEGSGSAGRAAPRGVKNRRVPPAV
jgi:hypothetical protein